MSARALGVALVLALLGGCASVPQASRERDTEARQYITHPRHATLYVYRNDFSDATRETSVLYVDGRVIGSTLPGGYFRIDVLPGIRVLHGDGPDAGQFRLKAPEAEIAFIALEVAGGVSHFRQVEPQAAKREIARCCVLLENWAPGQRPLLR